MTIAPGTKLGRYEIRAKIGEGGMGEVYLAEDTKLDRKVALKILPADVAADQTRMRRFIQEAKAASALNHPNILTIYEIGQTDSTHFIATEYIEGETLRHHLPSGMRLNEVLDISVQVAGALAAAHQAGIIHRDVKPENIMLRRDGIVKVLDFGLAKLSEKPDRGTVDAEAATKALVQTEPGVVMGTVAYMSPEQARGLTVDARTDIFSLGVVIYEMVAGRAPFGGTTRSDLIVALLEKDPPPLARFTSEAPAELERIVMKVLAKDPDERFQTAKDLLIDLKRLKQKLVVDAEIERSAPPELTAESRVAKPTDGRVVSTAPGAAGQKAIAGARTNSSAEYIISEIKRHKRGALLALAAFVAVTAAVALYFAYSRYAGGSSAGTIRSIAVLPFANTGGNPDAEYLSDGISESLINSLSQLPGVKVIARSSSFQYKGKEVNPQEVAKALGVQAIVTGRITQRGADLQISVELVNALDKTQMWGEQYNRRATDLQAVQAEIARTISEKLRLRLTGAQERQLTKRATANPQAYQLYLNGVYYQRKGNIEGTKKALDYLNQAVALDPNFALAFARMTPNYLNLMLNSALDPKEPLAKAKAAALKALELDETLADAHNALAGVRQYEWDWSGAESEYKRAIELDPNLAAAHANYAGYLANMGRLTEALVESKRHRELDPLSVNVKVDEADELFAVRRYDEAIQALQNFNKSQPDYAYAHLLLGFAYEERGMYAEAVKEYQKVIGIDGETTSTLCYLGHAYAMSGKRGEALAILNKLKTTKEYVSPAELAVLYIGLGDKEAAFQSLERAYTEHDFGMQYLKNETHYDPLRSDPRFTDLVRRVGL